MVTMCGLVSCALVSSTTLSHGCETTSTGTPMSAMFAWNSSAHFSSAGTSAIHITSTG